RQFECGKRARRQVMTAITLVMFTSQKMNIARIARQLHRLGPDGLRQETKRRLVAVSLFLLALSVYWGTDVWGHNTHPTYWVIFDQLADAFLHGHLYLTN